MSVHRAVAPCPNCNETIWAEHNEPHCPRCRTLLPEEIRSELPMLQQGISGQLPSGSQHTGSLFDGGRGSKERPRTDNPPSAPSDSASVESREAASLSKRYRDAYRVARLILIAGTVIKILGVAVGVLSAVSTLLFAGGVFLATVGKSRVAELGDLVGAQGAIVIVGLIWSVAIGGSIFLVGLLLSAQGQNLRASLDGAVNGSPFLTDQQRAKIMSL
jgi:hypothetical protein